MCCEYFKSRSMWVFRPGRLLLMFSESLGTLAAFATEVLKPSSILLHVNLILDLD